MDKKIELSVSNITNSNAQVGAFALLLSEVDGERELPIIIGPAEAQSTAMYLKGMETPRPLTHDLFITTLNALEARLQNVLIYKAKEGIFYSAIFIQKGKETFEIDARTSDAVALAVRADCPIYIYESILNRECLRISKEEKTRPQGVGEETEVFGDTGAMVLEEAMKRAIQDENYELAAMLRDKLNEKKKPQ